VHACCNARQRLIVSIRVHGGSHEDSIVGEMRTSGPATILPKASILPRRRRNGPLTQVTQPAEPRT
jgi:hypothetical protein